MSGWSALGRAVAVIAVMAAGLGIWGAGVFGVAQYAEDLCFDDLESRSGYGAYTASGELWPPSYECELRGNDVPPVIVQHRGVALAQLGATVVWPIAFVVAVMLGIVLWRRRADRGAA